MTGEELYARVWAATARAEGHMKRLPSTPVGRCNPLDKDTAKKRLERIRQYAAKGLNMQEIADLLGISRARVNRICLERGIAVKHIPFGPKVSVA